MINNENVPAITVKKIIFNNGVSISLNKDDIVLLVGANNVGKSRMLKDINSNLLQLTEKTIIIDQVEYETENLKGEFLEKYFEDNYFKDIYGNFNYQITENQSYCFSKENFKNVNDGKDFYKCLFTFLSTENRLSITKPIIFNTQFDMYSLKILQILEKDKESISLLNNILSNIFYKAIDVYEDYINNTIVVKGYKIGDAEKMKKVIDLNKRENTNELKLFNELYDQGDGIRSAVAILASLIVNQHSLFLIDEPETFLHPPQARVLGENMVKLSEGKQCFISTHNIDFIRGVLNNGSKRVKIIKIDREDDINQFYVLDSESICKIADDKNLKYTNILNGLFYKRIVLCENESDCKFYSVILESLDLNLYQNTLFCAVGGKDQFKIISPLLQKLCITYSIIADIDLINDINKLNQLLNSIKDNGYNGIKEIHNEFITLYEQKSNDEVKTQENIKKEINSLFTADLYMSDETAKKIKRILKGISSFSKLKQGGKGIIPQGRCVTLFNEINEYLQENNIFILECGEIERFISDVEGHGNSWVEKVFSTYPDISDCVYNDVKIFLKKVFGL